MDKTASRRKRHLSRREFAQATVFAAATAVALPSGLLAQVKETTKPAPPPPASQESKPLCPADEPEVNARLESIFRRYGSRLNDEQRADIRRQVTDGQKSLADLRAFPLDNADEPATVLRILSRLVQP
jgi:hypothetical protein